MTTPGNFSRVDILGAGESIESRSLQLLDQLKSGEKTISDLMGPLHGIPNLTTEVNLPKGTKDLFPTSGEAELFPRDMHNTLLTSNIHPTDYANPEPDDCYDLIAIGAGVSGLLSVIIGAWLGKKCALIERHGMGGDCLNTGCVPSKALIACAKAAHQARNLAKFGVHIPTGEVTIDFPFIMERMREIRAKISHHDSVQRYSKDFCKHVFVGSATFASEKKIIVTGDDGTQRVLTYKKAMIATGASAAIPPIPGLREVPHLTNGNLFNLTEMPPRLLVIGCGPIGLEIAQSMRRFGAAVVCFEMGGRLLPREDAQAAEVLRKQLEEDGLKIYFNVEILNIERSGVEADIKNTGRGMYCAPWGTYTVTVRSENLGTIKFEAEQLLNATGRAPNVHGLGLEAVGVEWDNRTGVHINEYFQTKNLNIYACGDCASAYKFTHSADFQARMAVRNMFLGETGKSTDLLIPWCTYTEPEIAHVGKYEDELSREGVEFESFVKQLGDVDRCVCDGVNEGFVKITMKAGTSQIIGATICGPNAGDMISEITLAMQYGISVPQLAGTIHPYPTTQEAVRLTCLGFNKYLKDPVGVPLATLRLAMNEYSQHEANDN